MFGRRKRAKSGKRLKRIEQCITERYPHFTVGANSYGCPRILEWGEGTILRVGSYCSIGEDVKIFLGGEHRTDWVSYYPFNEFWEEALEVEGQPYSKGDVTIGSDVWVGFGATILSGVTIGHGAIIGAHAVVARDVEPYTIVVGNPARPVRKRFDDATIERLLATAWWSWPEEKLRQHVKLLLSSDIERFLSMAESEAG